MPTGSASSNKGRNKVMTAVGPRATGLRFARGRVVVLLADSREVSVPLAWYPTLRGATAAQRAGWQLLGDGVGFYWPSLDLDLSTEGLVAGLREGIPRPPAVAGLKGARRKTA